MGAHSPAQEGSLEMPAKNQAGGIAGSEILHMRHPLLLALPIHDPDKRQHQVRDRPLAAGNLAFDRFVILRGIGRQRFPGIHFSVCGQSHIPPVAVQFVEPQQIG
jgi:hypothetical protein